MLKIFPINDVFNNAIYRDDRKLLHNIWNFFVHWFGIQSFLFVWIRTKTFNMKLQTHSIYVFQ